MAAWRPLRDFALAVTLLTVVPLPVRMDSVDERNDSPSYFPLVGLFIGCVFLGFVWLAHRFFYGLSPTATAIVLLAVALFTRFLHWDGLADVADGWFVPPERRLEVMSESAVGAFGVMAVVFAVLIQWSALGEAGSTAATVAPVVCVPVMGRLAATFAAWLGTPAKPTGLGRSVTHAPTAPGVLVTALSVIASGWIGYFAGGDLIVLMVVAAGGILSALVVPHVVAAHFGGVTGDTMGASVAVVETIVLVTIVTASWALRLLGAVA